MKQYRKLKRRIDKDKQRKAERRKSLAVHDSLDGVLTYKHAVRAVRACTRNVAYKKSVQLFLDGVIVAMVTMIRTIRKGSVPDVATDKQVAIRERGKSRAITPIIVNDRHMQHIISDNAIMPLLSRKLIYANCANQRGKGTTLARHLLNDYLEKAKRMWSTEFYVCVFDFKNFFGSIPHKECQQVLNSIFTDNRITRVAISIIISYQIKLCRKKRKQNKENYSEAQMQEDIRRLRNLEGVGICLGSQISQDMAISVPGPIDHYIKETEGMKFYVRFADDGVIIWKEKAELKRVLYNCSRIAAEHGLTIHEKKTTIVKATKGFEFMKTHYRIKPNRNEQSLEPETVKTLDRSSQIRMRRKLHKYVHLTREKKMTVKEAEDSVRAWSSHTTHASCFRTVRRIRKQMHRQFCSTRRGRKCTTTSSGTMTESR